MIQRNKRGMNIFTPCVKRQTNIMESLDKKAFHMCGMWTISCVEKQNAEVQLLKTELYIRKTLLRHHNKSRPIISWLWISAKVGRNIGELTDWGLDWRKITGEKRPFSKIENIWPKRDCPKCNFFDFREICQKTHFWGLIWLGLSYPGLTKKHDKRPF